MEALCSWRSTEAQEEVSWRFEANTTSLKEGGRSARLWHPGLWSLVEQAADWKPTRLSSHCTRKCRSSGYFSHFHVTFSGSDTVSHQLSVSYSDLDHESVTQHLNRGCSTLVLKLLSFNISMFENVPSVAYTEIISEKPVHESLKYVTSTTEWKKWKRKPNGALPPLRLPQPSCHVLVHSTVNLPLVPHFDLLLLSASVQCGQVVFFFSVKHFKWFPWEHKRFELCRFGPRRQKYLQWKADEYFGRIVSSWMSGLSLPLYSLLENIKWMNETWINTADVCLLSLNPSRGAALVVMGSNYNGWATFILRLT